MKGREDIESYMGHMGLQWETIAEDMWRVDVNDGENLVVSLSGPVVVLRIKVMEAPAKNREAFYERLLALNTTELMHGAFGLEGQSVVIVAALALENLDFNEFQGAIDDILLAIGKLYPELAKFREAA
jgi:hypothetical protein